MGHSYISMPMAAAHADAADNQLRSCNPSFFLSLFTCYINIKPVSQTSGGGYAGCQVVLHRFNGAYGLLCLAVLHFDQVIFKSGV